MKIISDRPRRKVLDIALITALVLGGTGYAGYRVFLIYEDLISVREELTVTQQMKQETEDNLLNVQSRAIDLENELEDERRRNGTLTERNRDYGERVDTLTKLTTIDPELLKKYSKVFFLSENYEPTGLKDIPREYISAAQKKQLSFHEDALSFLLDLLEEAEDDDIPLQVTSAYRSFEEQASLKEGYKVVYGAGTANQFSAEQGYSEHQLGTALDFTVPTIAGPSAAFQNTPAYPWLLENAHNFGFIISYPPGNKYYQVETWHWRFVGVKLAKWLHKEGLNFYDADQQDIDKYLIYIFD